MSTTQPVPENIERLYQACREKHSLLRQCGMGNGRWIYFPPLRAKCACGYLMAIGNDGDLVHIDDPLEALAEHRLIKDEIAALRSKQTESEKNDLADAPKDQSQTE